MRSYLFITLVVVCGGCSLPPYKVQRAPVNPVHAVVFDIDGTLTPKPTAIFTARKDAAKAVNQFSNSGIKIIYLSARIVPFQRMIPGWLKSEGFPEGSIHVPYTEDERNDYTAFKAKVLKQYTDNGWTFIAAYGDSTSDFKAYSQAGIDRKKIFALKRSNEDSCQSGTWTKCYSTWSDQLEDNTHQLNSF